MHVKELLSLKGKVILVTGGDGRFGKCMVKGLAEADGTVITASRNLQAGQKLAEDFKKKKGWTFMLCNWIRPPIC